MRRHKNNLNGSLDDGQGPRSSPRLVNDEHSLEMLKSASLSRKLPMATPDPTGDDIARWQASTTTEFASDHEGIAARLLRVCVDSLAHILVSTQNHSACKHLRRSLAILKLWSMGHGAWDGRLDNLLERSKDLRRTTLSILNPLCKILNSGLHTYAESDSSIAIRLKVQNSQIHSQTRWLLKETHGDVSDSDSEGYSSSDSDNSIPGNKRGGLDRLAEDVKMHVQCLSDLSNALEAPAIDPEPTDNPGVLKIEQRAAHDYHVDLITAKFPKAKFDLAESLGKMSWDRYRRMQQEREMNASNMTGSALEEEAVASAQKSRIADSEFKDSGLGTSLPAPPTRYAETVISFMTSIAGGKRVQIPPLPQEARSGCQFECNACGRHIRAINNREWRKHLYLDLQPYTCLFAGCAFNAQPFSDRQLWSNHLELDHQLGPDWKSVMCPLCLESTESGKSKMLIHFARHMEDVALAALPREVDDETEHESDISSLKSASTLPQSTEGDNIMVEHETSTKNLHDANDEQTKTQAEDAGNEGLNRAIEDMRSEQPETSSESPREEADKQLESERSDKRLSRVRDLWERGATQAQSASINQTHPLMVNIDFAMCHCKIYELKRNDWHDLGTGYVKIVSLGSAQWGIVVWSEDEAEIRRLLWVPIWRDDGFQRQQDTLIVWTTQSGIDMAMSFQHLEGCSTIWQVIKEVSDPVEQSDPERIKGSDDVERLRNASDRLQAWYAAHTNDPYPSASQISMLAQECGITELQIESGLNDLRTASKLDESYGLVHESQASIESDEGTDEPKYCFCNEASYGDMIACDNDECPREWFHLACVGLDQAPRATSKWFCGRQCKEEVAKRGSAIAGTYVHDTEHKRKANPNTAGSSTIAETPVPKSRVLNPNYASRADDGSVPTSPNISPGTNMPEIAQGYQDGLENNESGRDMMDNAAIAGEKTLSKNRIRNPNYGAKSAASHGHGPIRSQYEPESATEPARNHDYSQSDQPSRGFPSLLETHPYQQHEPINSSVTSARSAVTGFSSTVSTPNKKHTLSDYACKQIHDSILKPILAEEDLKDFHSLVQDIPRRIGEKSICNLRDLEKTFIFLAPELSATATSYLRFCERFIQLLHATVEHLSENDQRLQSDRLYTNNYFLDLVEQVRRYAAIMAATRQKESKGEELDDMDYSRDETITLRGGLSHNGRPIELVREKDGKVLPLAEGNDGRPLEIVRADLRDSSPHRIPAASLDARSHDALPSPTDFLAYGDDTSRRRAEPSKKGRSRDTGNHSSSRARRPTKLPSQALLCLQKWLREHRENPYPSPETKRVLAQECSITENQVNAWFINARARKLPHRSPEDESDSDTSVSSIVSTGSNSGHQHLGQPKLAPVDPAVQYPPCNTLCVGNLPIDVTEEELKAVFAKQRGYKRFCFRTKQNGPMCFVQFEDIPFATQACDDLNGYWLHNSVKGGITLSFSKNPLGVRSEQDRPTQGSGVLPRETASNRLNVAENIVAKDSAKDTRRLSTPTQSLAYGNDTDNRRVGPSKASRSQTEQDVITKETDKEESDDLPTQHTDLNEHLRTTSMSHKKLHDYIATQNGVRNMFMSHYQNPSPQQYSDQFSPNTTTSLQANNWPNPSMMSPQQVDPSPGYPSISGLNVPPRAHQPGLDHPTGKESPQHTAAPSLAEGRVRSNVNRCGTCRLRKKKCDGAKPECNNCTRGGFQCLSYASKVTRSRNAATKPQPQLQTKEHTEQGLEANYPRCAVCNQIHIPHCEPSRAWSENAATKPQHQPQLQAKEYTKQDLEVPYPRCAVCNQIHIPHCEPSRITDHAYSGTRAHPSAEDARTRFHHLAAPESRTSLHAGIESHNFSGSYYNTSDTGSTRQKPQTIGLKARLTKEQHEILEQQFMAQHKPSTLVKKELASKIGVPLDKVNNWFQNRRATVKQDRKRLANQMNMMSTDFHADNYFGSSVEIGADTSLESVTELPQQPDPVDDDKAAPDLVPTGKLHIPETLGPPHTRGRPPMQAPQPPTTLSKLSKARKKTGCLTCRKRRRKCDEMRPSCLVCKKNNIDCEGYAPARIGQSTNTKPAGDGISTNIETRNDDLLRPLSAAAHGISESIEVGTNDDHAAFHQHPQPKQVIFERLPSLPGSFRADLPLRVDILPGDTTDSIITKVKDFYGLYNQKGITFEHSDGSLITKRYENFEHNMRYYVRVLAEDLDHKATSPGSQQSSVSPPPSQAKVDDGPEVLPTKSEPVAFNTAISFVNKIKARFASQPEIYKQFLEIVQTHQRESRPIQDVYAQVTTLFSAAPDLVEDFKMFLPDTAAQVKNNQAKG